MKKKKTDLIKPAGSSPRKTKASIPPEHSSTAVDVQPLPDREDSRFPIVGIGASAGGLAASHQTGGPGKGSALHYVEVIYLSAGW